MVMTEEVARIAGQAAREALMGWSPTDPDGLDRLAAAIGEAVAAGVCRRAEIEARSTALTMEQSCEKCAATPPHS